MKTAWTKHTKDQEQIAILRSEYKGSRILRERLTQLLEGKIKTEMSETRAKDGYDNPSWPYRQADSQGYMRALNEIISLISD